MAEAATEIEEEPKKPSKLPLIIALVVALAGGGGAFFAIYSGMILGSGEAGAEAHAEEESEPFTAPDVVYVPIDPMVISLGKASEGRHLRFTANIEVPTNQEGAVTKVIPRIVDVLNGYMRALRMEDLEDPAALVRIRAQMLRRIQVVTGPDAVSDLLIVEFVLN
ncbi:flagellar FliL protein [Pseudooceanicola antarcticus]|uniref:Flagellar protein FliL n=1 Tax=Pseudooceanicola antarcticus TaxID=1247613 RepID=A0A285HZ97_9RHOB|nr:flagellar basal body-associated FliL family protein [Pseudooceanicola antarcticus]PJE27394.1 flagellar basal body protein FliL [Pseudooceanicola antarcticus]SNY40021.1 flagellar FliL protein [Pseudooceanicola antarcticus]